MIKVTKMLLPSLIAVLACLAAVLFSQNNKELNNVLSEIEQSTSQALFSLHNLADSMLLTSTKSNFKQNESAPYLTTRYTQFIRISDKMFQSYLYLQSMLLGKNTEDIYNSEITTWQSNQLSFNLNLTKIMTNSTIPINFQCSNPYIFENKKIRLAKPFSKLSNISTENFKKTSYKKMRLIASSQSLYNGNLINLPMSNQMFNYTLIEALNQYVLKINCYASQLMQEMWSTSDTSHFTVYNQEIHTMAQQYQQYFAVQFDEALSLSTNISSNIQTILNVSLIIVLAMAFYYQLNSITKHIANRVIASDIDKGSILQQLSHLSTKKVEEIIDSFRQEILRSKKNDEQKNSKAVISEGDKKAHESDVQYSISDTLLKYLQCSSKIFLKAHHRWVIPVFVLVSICYLCSIYFKQLHFQFPYKYSNYENANSFNLSSAVPPHFIPNVDFPALESDNQEYPDAFKSIMINQYKTSEVAVQDPIQASLFYVLKWIRNVPIQAKLNNDTIEQLIAVPHSQIVYLNTYLMQQPERYSNSTDLMRKMLEQLQYQVCVIQINSQNDARTISYRFKQNNQQFCVGIKNYTVSNRKDPNYGMNSFTFSNDPMIQYSFEQIADKFNKYIDTKASTYLNTNFVFYIIYVTGMVFLEVLLLVKVLKYIIVPMKSDDSDLNLVKHVVFSSGRKFLTGIMTCIVFIGILTLLYDATENVLFFRKDRYIKLVLSTSIFEFNVASFLILFAVYNNYVQNVLVLIASVGVPAKRAAEDSSGAKEVIQFIKPFELPTALNLIYVRVFNFVVGLFLFSLLIMMKMFYYSSESQGDAFQLSRLTSLLNHKSMMLQNTLGLDQNQFSFYQDYFDGQIQLLTRQFTTQKTKMNILQKLVNLPDFGNVTQQLLVHDLVDGRWKWLMRDVINLAPLSFEEANRPSFVYGNVNMSEFMKLPPPRTMRIGPHLQKQDDGLNQVSAQAVVSLMMSLGQMKIQQWQPLLAGYGSLGPDHTAGTSLGQASDVQKTVISLQKTMNTDLPVLSAALNSFACDQLALELQQQIDRRLRMMNGMISFLIIGGAGVAVLYWFARKKTQNFLVKNNLFASLFLKKIMRVLPE